jgi:glycosyltransferase involved in cell wall biosynthesis
VVVIDDGSSDDTADRAEAAGAMVIRRSPNAGKGAALRAGFRHALDAGAPAVVTLDADGQHDPDEIPVFLERFETRRAELIVGQRDLGEMPPVRRLSNTLGGLALAVALGRSVPDNQSGYRLIGRALMRAMLDSDESGFEFEVEMIARCLALGLPIDAVPIRTISGDPKSPEDRPRRVTGRGLVLAATPKYGLEKPPPHSYSLPRSGTDPTPEYPRGPEPPDTVKN